MKHARLSFADDLGDDDDSDGGAPVPNKGSAGGLKPIRSAPVPIKKMRQAPPPTYIFQAAKDEEETTTYSKDSLEALKAAQKFVALKSVETEVSPLVEETILAGEEAEKAMALAEAQMDNLAPMSASSVGLELHDKETLAAGRLATKELLKVKDNERIYMSTQQPARSIDLGQGHDLSWEDELMQRGMIGSKARDLNAKPKPATGIFGARSKDADVDIKDVINNIQAMLAKTQFSIDANERRVEELKAHAKVTEAQRAQAQADGEVAAGRLAAVQTAKELLRNVVFMLREKMPLVEDVRDACTELTNKAAGHRRDAWSRWQERRLLLVKDIDELVSIGNYDPIGELAGKQSTGEEFVFPTTGSRQLEDAALGRDWEHALAKIFAGTTWLAMGQWNDELAAMLAKKSSLLADVAEEMLSLTDILRQFAVLRNTLPADEYASAFMSLSAFQICEAVVMMDLAGQWQPWPSECIAFGQAWLQPLAAFAESNRSVEAGLETILSQDELGDEDILPQVVMSAVVPWLRQGLAMVDLRSRTSCQRGFGLCAHFLALLQSHGTSGTAHATKFRGQIGAELFAIVSGAIESMCLPVCRTVVADPRQGQDHEQAVQRGAWPGMGKAVMAFQLATVAMMWRHASIFQEYLLDHSQAKATEGLLWSSLSACQPALSKLLRSEDARAVRLAVEVCEVVLHLLERTPSSTTFNYKLLRAACDKLESADRANSADGFDADSVSALSSALGRIRP